MQLASVAPDWARHPNGTICAMETGSFATLRFCFEGTRTIRCARFTSLGQHVRNLKGPRVWKQPISTLAVKTWLEAASPTTVDEAVAAGVDVFGASLGKHDLLWLPSGFMRVEHTGQMLTHGFRMAFFYKEDAHDLACFKAINADLLNMRKRNSVIEIADRLKTQELKVASAGTAPPGIARGQELADQEKKEQHDGKKDADDQGTLDDKKGAEEMRRMNMIRMVSPRMMLRGSAMKAKRDVHNRTQLQKKKQEERRARSRQC